VYLYSFFAFFCRLSHQIEATEALKNGNNNFTVLDTIKIIYKENDSLSGFYKGLGAKVVTVVPARAVFWTTHTFVWF
jgi:hypothetical protein